MSKVYVLKNGTFAEVQDSKVKSYPGISLEKIILDTLSKDTCCVKDLTADAITATSVTATTVTGTTVVTDTISEKTAATGVTVDGVKLKDGGVTANDMYAGFFPTSAAQALSGAGAVNVSAYLTKFTSTGAAQALTITSGTQIGQMKRVWHVVDGGSGVLTGVYVGGTTITFTTANEFADIMWIGSSWAVLALGNFTAGGASPALA